MANSERGEIEITLGKTEYTLLPTFNAMCVIERKTGKSMMAMALEVNLLTHMEVATVIQEFCRGNKKPKIESIGADIIAEGMLGSIKVMGEILSTALGGRKDSSEEGEDSGSEGSPNA